MGLKWLQAFFEDEGGQDVVEFTLLLVLLGAASLIAMTSMSNSLHPMVERIDTWLSKQRLHTSQ